MKGYMFPGAPCPCCDAIAVGMDRPGGQGEGGQEVGEVDGRGGSG